MDNSKERALSEIIMNGDCSYGDVQMYMDANRLDKLIVGDCEHIVSKDKIGKLCVSFVDVDGVVDSIGLDVFLAINKQGEQIDEVSNNKGYMKTLIYIAVMMIITALVLFVLNYFQLNVLAFCFGMVFEMAIMTINKIYDNHKKKKVSKG